MKWTEKRKIISLHVLIDLLILEQFPNSLHSWIFLFSLFSLIKLYRLQMIVVMVIWRNYDFGKLIIMNFTCNTIFYTLYPAMNVDIIRRKLIVWYIHSVWFKPTSHFRLLFISERLFHFFPVQCSVSVSVVVFFFFLFRYSTTLNMKM